MLLRLPSRSEKDVSTEHMKEIKIGRLSDPHSYCRLSACNITDAAILLGQQQLLDIKPANGLQRRPKTFSKEAICCRRALSSRISLLHHTYQT